LISQFKQTSSKTGAVHCIVILQSLKALRLERSPILTQRSRQINSPAEKIRPSKRLLDAAFAPQQPALQAFAQPNESQLHAPARPANHRVFHMWNPRRYCLTPSFLFTLISLEFSE
jgi:hypothetical protein